MNVIVKPLITEKMTALSEKLNCYGFIVDQKANKLQIKQAVETMYNVTVESVRTMNYRGKLKARYTRSGFHSGMTNGCKKAIVAVADGDKIDFYSSI